MTKANAIFFGFLNIYHRKKMSKGNGDATTTHDGAPKLATLYPNRTTKQPIAKEAKT